MVILDLCLWYRPVTWKVLKGTYKDLSMMLMTQLNFLLFRKRIWTEIPQRKINGN